VWQGALFAVRRARTIVLMSTNADIPLPSPAYLANDSWIEAHLDRLARDYPEQWVAVDRGRVLAAGPDLGRVTEEANRAGASPDAAFEFIASASMIL
jgi:hypothetical protein